MNVAVGTESWNNQLRNAWTDEKVAELRRLVAAGWSASKIADEIGGSRNAVIGKVLRLGLRLRGNPSALLGKPATALKRQARNATPGSASKPVGRPGITDAPDAAQQTDATLAKSPRSPRHSGVSANQTPVRLDEASKRGNAAAAFVNRQRAEAVRAQRLDDSLQTKADRDAAASIRLRCFDPKPDGVALADLMLHHCRWPHSEGEALRYCGDAREGAGPYCEHHGDIARGVRFPRAFRVKPKRGRLAFIG